MKVLQILPELRVGGVETGTVDLAKYLIEHNHKAIVVSNGGELVEELTKHKATHYALPVHKKSIWTIIRCIRELRKIIKDEKVDIVHARSRVPGWIAFFACRHTDAALITTCHGYYSNHFFSRVMGWAKFVIVASQVIGRHMIDDFGVQPECIRRIPRSVDLDRFAVTRPAKKNKSEFIVSIVGRITPLKGHEYFLKAMAKVVRSCPYVKIWIIGDAPAKKVAYKDGLKVLVKRLGLTDYVDFLGNRRDIPQLLSMTDVLVLSTVTEEAFGRVILEAQAVGVPVVATKVGGVVDIIEHEKTGLLVPPKDTDEMARAVIRILKDNALQEQLNKNALKKIEENFTLEHMASRTLEVYREALASLRILVIKISSLGDVVLVTASLRAIRNKFPNAKIYCMVGKESRQILQRCPFIDDIIIYDPKHKDRGPRRLWRFSRKLREYQFDKIVDFQNNHKSHILSFLSFPKESYGYNNGKLGFLLSSSIRNTEESIPAVEHQFKVLKMLDIDYSHKNYLELWPSPEDDRFVQSLFDDEWLGDNPNIVGVNLSASERWKSKNWPVGHIAQLCDILSGKNIRVAVTGIQQEAQAARELLKLTKAKPANFVGKTDIMQLASLIKRCKVFVTPDSCPMHIAAAMKIPCVALFGATDPVRHIPPAEKLVVLKKEMECAPCYNPLCEMNQHDCMNAITPADVAKAIEELIKK